MMLDSNPLQVFMLQLDLRLLLDFLDFEVTIT